MLTDYDLHLLGEGKHWKSYNKLGAQLCTRNGQKGVHFALWAPNAEVVSVVGFSRLKENIISHKLTVIERKETDCSNKTYQVPSENIRETERVDR